MSQCQSSYRPTQIVEILATLSHMGFLCSLLAILPLCQHINKERPSIVISWHQYVLNRKDVDNQLKSVSSSNAAFLYVACVLQCRACSVRKRASKQIKPPMMGHEQVESLLLFVLNLNVKYCLIQQLIVYGHARSWYHMLIKYLNS